MRVLEHGAFVLVERAVARHRVGAVGRARGALQVLLAAEDVDVELGLAPRAVVAWLLCAVGHVEAEVDAHDGVEHDDEDLGEEVEDVEAGAGEVPGDGVGLALGVAERDLREPGGDGAEALADGEDKAADEEDGDGVAEATGAEFLGALAGDDEGDEEEDEGGQGEYGEVGECRELEVVVHSQYGRIQGEELLDGTDDDHE